MKTAEHITVGIRHPLDPLTAEEIETVSQILKRDRGLAGSARFVYVTLREPAKDAVLKYQPGEPFEREAHVVIRERAERTSYEAVVSLTDSAVRELPRFLEPGDLLVFNDTRVVAARLDRKSVRVGKECRSRWSPYH